MNKPLKYVAIFTGVTLAGYLAFRMYTKQPRAEITFDVAGKKGTFRLGNMEGVFDSTTSTMLPKTWNGWRLAVSSDQGQFKYALSRNGKMIQSGFLTGHDAGGDRIAITNINANVEQA